MKNLLLLIIIVLFSGPILGQNNLIEPGEVFRDDVVPKIFVTIHPDSLDALLDLSIFDREHLYPGTFRFTNGTIDETVENVGFRLRGNTSLSSAKKSLKISFNSFGEKRKWKGLEKMNINGEHNDPSISRSKIVWDMARKMELPGSRSNHVELYVNGEYVGLYINIEHIDEQYIQSRFDNDQGNLYKCFYGADLHYRGVDPNNYKHEPFGRRTYDLKTNKKADDYADLAHFINVLNNTGLEELPCALEAVFNVQDWLKYLALHILSGHWDDAILNKNNYYLYHNLSTGKFEYILYDLDNSLGVDFLNNNLAERSIVNWGNNSVNNPLYHRIMQVPEYRNQLYFILDKAVEDFYNQDFYLPYIFDLRDKLSASVENDPLHSADYGFTFEEWEDSFLEDLDYGHVELSIYEYIVTRSNSILDQLPSYEVLPVFNFPKVNYKNKNEDFSVSVKVIGENISTVKFYTQNTITGDNNCTELADDGMNTDQQANDQIYSGITNALMEGEYLQYFIAIDEQGNESDNSFCGIGRIYVETNPRKITVNEFVANNDNGIVDEVGEFEDWIEMYNLDDSDNSLNNLYLSDNFDIPAKFKIPNQNLNANDYKIIWADNDTEQGQWHTNFKLKSEGEQVMLFEEINGQFTLIDYIEFDNQGVDSSFARIPNGTGSFQNAAPTPLSVNSLSSTNELPEAVNIEIFPNPVFNNTINIKAPDYLQDTGTATYTIYHSNGKIVYSAQSNTFLESIVLGQFNNEFTAGVYFLKITGASITYQGKFIKL